MSSITGLHGATCKEEKRCELIGENIKMAREMGFGERREEFCSFFLGGRDLHADLIFN